MTLAHLLVRQARQHPDSSAILNGDALQATHHQWAARSAGLAQRTRDAGLQPGDRVLVFARNHPRYLEVLWSLWWAGLVAVPAIPNRPQRSAPKKKAQERAAAAAAAAAG